MRLIGGAAAAQAIGRFLILALCMLAARVGTEAAAPTAIAERLRCEFMVNPVGIDEVKPRLSWQMRAGSGGERGQRQTAYQVLVATRENLLGVGRSDLWDSGKVESDQSAHVVYSGVPLPSGRRCFWKVRVWDRNGRDLGWSQPAFWEMGLLQPGDWKAQWISVDLAEGDSAPLTGASWIWHPEGNTPAAGERFFRRQVALPVGARIRSARFTFTADDQFTLFVNGKQAAKSSGQTDAWRQPKTGDLGPFLAPGVNTIAVAARNTGGPAGLIGRITVEFDKGKPFGIVTDGLWKTSREAGSGWQEAGFDDAAWTTTARIIARFGQSPWTGLAAPDPARYLRRSFVLRKPVQRAVLYATALGVYEPYLNGRRIGEDIFAPGWTDYRKRVRYQTYDVTRLLRRGDNALGLILGDGWYAGHVGLAGRGVYGTLPLALCQLQVEYRDGTRETVGTDEAWRGAAGPIRASDQLMGETYDARREMPGWSAPGFRDPAWRPVVTRKVETALEAQRGLPSGGRRNCLRAASPNRLPVSSYSIWGRTWSAGRGSG